MRLRLRLWWRLARCAFARRAAYRLANLSGIAVNFFFFLIHAQVFLAFFRTRDGVAGWSGSEAVLYFATSEALLMVLGVMSAATPLELSRRVIDGDVVVDLARPLHLFARHLAEGYGTSAYYLLARTLPIYVLATSLYGLAPPLQPELLWLPASLFAAIGLSSLVGYAFAASAFWLESGEGVVRFLPMLAFVFGGVVVPLDFYPAPLRALCDLLPFRAVIYTPVALATGKLTGAALAYALVHQALWLAGGVAIARGLERRGTRRLAALGG